MLVCLLIRGYVGVNDMRVGYINNNKKNTFGSTFVKNKNLSLAFELAVKNSSKDFLKTVRKLANDGNDRQLQMFCSTLPLNGDKKDGKLIVAYFTEHLNNGVMRYVDRHKFSKCIVKSNDNYLVSGKKKSRVCCTLIERFFPYVKDAQVDKMSDAEVQRNLKAIRKKIFIG